MVDIFDEFQQYISDTLESLCGFMKIDKGILSFEILKPKIDVKHPQKTEWIHSQTFSIQINSSTSSWLMQIAKDVVIAKIEHSAVLFPENGTLKWRICDSAVISSLGPRDFATLLYHEIKETLERRCYKLLGFEVNWIDRLSLMRYEGDSLVGKIVLECSDDASFDTVRNMLCPQVCADERGLELNGDNLRQICKLMVGSGSGALLFHRQGDGNSQYQCMGYVSKGDLETFPYYIEITGTLEWTLYAFGRAEFHYSYDKPQALPDSMAALLCGITEEFGVDNSVCEKYRVALSAIAKQKHGTSAIFVDMSDDGSRIMGERLENLYKKKRALKGDSLCLDNPAGAQIWTNLARMDGAFVADIITGELLYLTVIVDGQACIDGDNARGARFNSLKNFVADISKRTREDEGKKLKAMAAIFSEDGGVDVVRASTLWPGESGCCLPDHAFARV